MVLNERLISILKLMSIHKLLSVCIKTVCNSVYLLCIELSAAPPTSLTLHSLSYNVHIIIVITLECKARVYILSAMQK